MTLLVIKVDLPEDFHPTSAAELGEGLLGLEGTFISLHYHLPGPRVLLAWARA
jgi:hypothetical protein